MAGSDDLDVAVRYVADTTQFEAAAARAETAVEGVGEAAAASSTEGTRAVKLFTDAEKALASQMLKVEAASKAKAKALGVNVGQLRQIEKQLSVTTNTMDGTESSVRKGTSAFQALATQLPDVVVQLEAGQNPFQILLQQGSQVAEQMGIMGQVAGHLARALPILAVAVAGAATAYGVYKNATEEAASSTLLLEARLKGVESAIAQAKGRIEGASGAIRAFYSQVADAEAAAAVALGQLTAEQATYEKGVKSLESAINPVILAHEQERAALMAKKQILAEQFAAMKEQGSERDKLGQKLWEMEKALQRNGAALKAERDALVTGTQALGVKRDADMREREAAERAAKARSVATQTRKVEKDMTLEQRWAQEQLNAAFDAEMARLNARAAILPTLMARVEGLSAAEMDYRETIEGIGEAEMMVAITADEALALREVAANDWVKANTEAIAKVTEAEQRRIEAEQRAHEEKLQRIEEERKAQLALASDVIGQVGALLSATTAISDAAMQRGEEAHEKLAGLQDQLAQTRAQYAEDQAKEALKLDLRRAEMTAEELADLERVNAEKAAIHQLEVNRIQSQIEMTRQNTKAARTAAAKAAKFAKAAALADIGLKTAQAVMAAFAQFGPPPSPVGIASAASALAIGGIQAGVVAATELPSYHVGGVKPGETLSRHLPGEATLNASATRELGPEGVRQLQMGAMPALPRLQIGRREVREMERLGLRSGGLYVGAIRAASTSSGPARGISGRGVIS